MYQTGAHAQERLSPAAWTHDIASLAPADNRRIQQGLLADYHSNVAQYPAWQAWLREHRPPAPIAWGKGAPLFVEAGARAWLRDLPHAELHLLDTGHFALEEEAARVADLIRIFCAKQHPSCLR